jgi:hypothetical protein
MHESVTCAPERLQEARNKKDHKGWIVEEIKQVNRVDESKSKCVSAFITC